MDETDDARSLFARAVELAEAKRLDEAIGAFERVAALHPDLPQGHIGRARALCGAGRTGDAARGIARAIALRPTGFSACHAIWHTLYRLAHVGAADDARRLAGTWRSTAPDDPTARHGAAALLGDDAPHRASDGYVTETFDHQLARIDYRAPDLLARAVAEEGLAPDGSRDVLDAGCGTGLNAPWLRPLARRLTGVDLSAGMLRRACDTGLYDRVALAELTGFLSRHDAAFDLVAAADVLIYFGALEELIGAAMRALRPGGLLAVTVERLDDDAPWRLTPSGRYAHGEAYLRRVLEASGAAPPRIAEGPLRTEFGTPVPGLIATARRAG